jgi:hypothetical protein
MSPHFRSYVLNLDRARLLEVIDRCAIKARRERARASLIFDPLTARRYAEDDIPPALETRPADG